MITRTELRHVMMNLGEKMSEEECDILCEVKNEVMKKKSEVKKN